MTKTAVPGAVRWYDAALGKLLLHKGLRGAQFLFGPGPLFHPYEFVRYPDEGRGGAPISGPA